MKINGINVVFLYVEDMARSRAFYEEALGLDNVAREEDNWVEWKLPTGSNLAICRARAGKMEGATPDRTTVRFSLVVDDIDGAADKLAETGAASVPEILDGPGFRFIDFNDPDGNLLRLLQWS